MMNLSIVKITLLKHTIQIFKCKVLAKSEMKSSLIDSKEVLSQSEYLHFILSKKNAYDVRD